MVSGLRLVLVLGLGSGLGLGLESLKNVRGFAGGGYLAGGFVGKEKCITSPSDVAGLQTRAAGKSFEQMLVGAGASIASMASSEIYSAMQR